jgi:hypothetical protein
MPSTPEPRLASRSWHASRASRLRYQQALIWREMRRLARSRDELARGPAPGSVPRGAAPGARSDAPPSVT